MNQEKWMFHVKYFGDSAHGLEGGMSSGHRRISAIAWEGLGLPKGKVLSVGDSDGTETEWMSNQGHDAYGCDLSTENFQKCKDRLKYSDMHELDYEDKEFDYIYCCHVFEHAIAPSMVLYEFNRILKKGGLVFISIPDTQERWIFDTNHVIIYMPWQVKALAEKTGFMPKFFGRSSMPEYEPDNQSQIFLLEKIADARIGTI